MSTRQNKKRKGRGNVLNRERTVTTLTEGTEGSFLSTTSEEPHPNLMSSPFSVASSTAGPSLSPSLAFMTPNFSGFTNSYSYIGSMPGPTFSPQQSQSHFFSAQPPPAGQNDLEILERLKETIKNNQHEYFQPVPRPAALASIYLGPRHVPPHPEQIPRDQALYGEQFPADTNSAAGELRELGTEPKATSETRSRVQGPGVWDNMRKLEEQSSVSNPQTTTANNVTRARGEFRSATDAKFSPLQAVAQSASDNHSSHIERGAGSEGPPNHKSIVDSPGKSMDMDPPGLNAPVVANDPTNFTLDSVGRHRTNYHNHGLGRTASEKSIVGDTTYGQKTPSDISITKSKYEGKNDPHPSRDSAWLPRDSTTSEDAKPERPDVDRPGANGDPRNAYNTNRWQRPPRDLDRDKDRDRERDRDWDRDRDRRPPDFGGRYNKDDRRIDDRFRYSDNRRPPPDQRHFESRYESGRTGDPVRRWDPKASGDHNTSSAQHPEDRIGPSTEARGPRPLGEERSFESRSSRVGMEDRPSTSRFSTQDDRDRPQRPDDRRPPLPVSDDRSVKSGPVDDHRPPLSGALPDRTTRPGDERRPLPPPSADDRQGKLPLPTEDRRPMNPPLASPGPNTGLTRPPVSSDDRRPSPSPRSSGQPTSVAGDRPSRLADDRRPPGPAAIDRPRAPPVDRRPSVPPSNVDRSGRLSDDRRPPEDYPTRSTGPPTASIDSTPRATDTRIQVPLEERIGRQPSLQERLSSRPIEPPVSRLEDRVSRPPAASAAEVRLTATSSDERATRSVQSEDRLGRPSAPAGSDSSTAPQRPGDTRTLPVDSSRGPPQVDRVNRPEERGRPQASDRFTADRTNTTTSGSAAPRYNYASNRPVSLVRDDAPPRIFKPPRDTTSPRRGEYRPIDRTSYPDRYERGRSKDRRTDSMEIDTPNNSSARFHDRPQSYRRPSPPKYVRQDRPWAPGGDTYSSDPTRRPASELPSTPGYARDWHENERGYDDWERRWERERLPDRDREGAFIERDPAPAPGWETREERDRRVSGGFVPPAAPPTRPFDSRPLSARLSDAYPPSDDRDRPFERARYPPIDASPSVGFSRVRQRSPSPLRRPGPGLEDLRPPLKRPRDDAYGPDYYSPPGIDSSRDYPTSRLRTPPPVGGYYDDTRPDYVSPVGSARERDRDRDFMDRESYGGYPIDRRDPPVGRAPPRSPPPYARGGYGRDERRYSAPPQRP
ncbi:hypothetical protein PHLCEN_2v3856 [Hermanssonia centrifuga]|uniref:Uncharacterized protein n=1 Tax=Hermanssonia centrifuga TaxID=98765 RepID=A0A2R6QBC0_9APHY|nr:hypothetical protein PHLCEN_2v3856 [Hermanssonia centrifuga]